MTNKKNTGKSTSGSQEPEVVLTAVEEQGLEASNEVVENIVEVEVVEAPVIVEVAEIPQSEKLRACVCTENHECTIGGEKFILIKDKVINLPHSVAIMLSNAKKVYIK